MYVNAVGLKGCFWVWDGETSGSVFVGLNLWSVCGVLSNQSFNQSIERNGIPVCVFAENLIIPSIEALPFRIVSFIKDMSVKCISELRLLTFGHFRSREVAFFSRPRKCDFQKFDPLNDPRFFPSSNEIFSSLNSSSVLNFQRNFLFKIKPLLPQNFFTSKKWGMRWFYILNSSFTGWFCVDFPSSSFVFFQTRKFPRITDWFLSDFYSSKIKKEHIRSSATRNKRNTRQKNVSPFFPGHLPSSVTPPKTTMKKTNTPPPHRIKTQTRFFIFGVNAGAISPSQVPPLSASSSKSHPSIQKERRKKNR